jgi:hypothetical protein
MEVLTEGDQEGDVSEQRPVRYRIYLAPESESVFSGRKYHME